MRPSNFTVALASRVGHGRAENHSPNFFVDEKALVVGLRALARGTMPRKKNWPGASTSTEATPNIFVGRTVVAPPVQRCCVNVCLGLSTEKGSIRANVFRCLPPIANLSDPPDTSTSCQKRPKCPQQNRRVASPWSQDHSLTRVRSKVGLVERNIGGLDNRRPRIELTLDEGLGFGRRTADRFKRGTSDQLLGLVAL